jgi:hypothetical protein
VKKLLHLIFITIFGWIGWVAGEKFGFMTAYFVSGFASMLGLYLSWKIGNRLLE